MTDKIKQILRRKDGAGFPLIIAITLSMVIIFTGISEYFRLMIVAQGVRDAVQAAVISTVVENYDDVYHGIREGYSGAYQPMPEISRKASTTAIFMIGWTASLAFPTVMVTMKNAPQTASWSLRSGIWTWTSETRLLHQVTKPPPVLKRTAPFCWRFPYPLAGSCCRP